MRASPVTRKVLGFTLAIAVIAYAYSIAFAQEMTSTNFRVNTAGFSELGGYSTTSSFRAWQSSFTNGIGESDSASFELGGGFEYFGDASPLATQNWRWYDDSTSGTPVVPFAGENVAPSAVGYDDPLKLRITVNDNGGNGVTNIKLRLQVSTSSDFTQNVLYVAEQGECGPSTPWCYADGGGANNGVISDHTLSDAQSCASGIGNGCGSYNESGTTTSLFYHFPGTRKEYDFTIKQTDAIQSTVYYFRLVDRDTSIPLSLNSGETYPSLTVSGGSLTFSIAGISSGQSTEGVTTDVATSPVLVAFGALSINDPTHAAHRLSVTTNAGSGYKVYAYQRQGLLSNQADEIAPVTGTNDSPLSWGSGCTISSNGCYGYHTGKDVLEGGSTRFAADDTYAQFTGAPTEVAYSAGPADAEITDMVYKVEVKEQQESGVYQSAIVYIVTPVF
jgi:hypothetical protein